MKYERWKRPDFGVDRLTWCWLTLAFIAEHSHPSDHAECRSLTAQLFFFGCAQLILWCMEVHIGLTSMHNSYHARSQNSYCQCATSVHLERQETKNVSGTIWSISRVRLGSSLVFLIFLVGFSHRKNLLTCVTDSDAGLAAVISIFVPNGKQPVVCRLDSIRVIWVSSGMKSH